MPKGCGQEFPHFNLIKIKDVLDKKAFNNKVIEGLT